MIANKIFEDFVGALPSLSGKCYAVTGTTSGTGYHFCVAGIQKGARCLILLNRSSARAEKAASELKALAGSGGTAIHPVDCDLQSFASVTRAAGEVQALAAGYGGLDGCINNAGVMALPDQRTPDGYDVQMQTNHLSHFLLTQLLLPSLEAAATARGEARVVQHSSGARRGGFALDKEGMLQAKYLRPAPPGELGGDTKDACFDRYHQTKLANSVFAMALHDKLTAAGSKVKSLCAEPGVSATSLAASMSQAHKQLKAAGPKAQKSERPGTAGGRPPGGFPGIQSAADGACSLIAAAFGHAESGDFFMPKDLVENVTPVGLPKRCMTAGQPTPVSERAAKNFEYEKLTMEPANRQLLWAESEAQTKSWLEAAGARAKL